MKRAQLADGTILEFPDETTDDVMDRAVRNHVKGTPVNAPQFKIGAEGLQQAAREVGAGSNILQKLGLGIGSAAQRIGQGLGLDVLGRKAGLLEPGARDVLQSAIQGAGPIAKGAQLAGDVGLLAAAPVGGLKAATTSVAPKIAGRIAASRPLTILDTMLTSGGLAAATTPGNIGERAVAGMTSAAISGALPTTLGVAQGARRMVTGTGRQIAKAESLRRELGEEASEALIPQLRGQYANAPLGVSPTAAMKTADPTLKALELGSRVKRPDLFANLDEANAAARWNVLQTLSSKNVQAPKIRDEVTKPLREAALSAASVKPVYTAKVSEVLDDLKTGAARPNKPVQDMVRYVEREIKKGVSPEQMYTLRKSLTDSIPSGTELGNSIKMARAERVRLVKAIDEGLDAASEGSWSVYMKTYQELSKPVTSQKAVGKIIEHFQKNVPEGVIPPGMGASPAAASFSRVLNREAQKQFGSQTFERLLPEDKKLLNMLAEDLYRQQGVMKSGAVIGSDTAAKIAAANRGDAVAAGLLGVAADKLSPVPGAGGLLSGVVRRGLEKKREEALAGLLLDPERLAQALEQARRAQTFMRAAAAPSRGLRGYTE